MENINALTVATEVLSLLSNFGYKPRLTAETDDLIEIGFPCKDGYDVFKSRHKDAVIALTKGFLNELYFAYDWYFVRIYTKCKGLYPDDNRYDHLIHCINRISSDEPVIYKSGVESFVNLGDRFDRVIIHY